MDKKQSGKNLLRSVQVIKYTCGAGTPEEAETNCTYFIRGECTASFCEYRRKKQTNADRIRAMSDEELAVFLSRDLKEPCDYCQLAVFEGACTEKLCDDAMMKWLQQPAEGE